MTGTITTPHPRAKRPRRVIDAKLRARIEAAVEQMIAALDALDAPAEDAEDDGSAEAEPDDEPEFGWTEFEARYGKYPPIDSRFPDAEPSLGFTHSINQTLI